jgi:DNA-binding transcriptional LysR family regulator
MDANSTTLQNELTLGQLDMVIDNQILPEDLFEQTQLTTEHLLLAVPAHFPENEILAPYRLTYEDILSGKHELAAGNVPIKKLQNVPFILMNRDNDTRNATEKIFQAAAFSPNVLFELDRLTTLYSYVELGTAASIITDTLVRNIHTVSPDHIYFYPINSQYACRGIYVSYKKNKYQSPAMQAFAESIADLK